MVVQICCSVDSHYFLRCLKKEFPNENIIGYFYDPNIHPYSEFLLRFEDVKRSAKSLNIEVFLGDYEIDEWFSYIKGLENEPERGKRCQKCFDFRVEKTALFAKKIGHNLITTTLLMSPKKSHDQLTKSLENISNKFDLKFIAPDYRKNGGSNEQFALAKKDNLYHQNYCGCMFAMDFKESLKFELMSPINNQILPNSADDRIKFYKKVRKFEEKNIKFQILKDSFINYRLLQGLVKFDNKPVKSYFLFNSHLEKKLIKFKITDKKSKILDLKNQIRLFSFNEFNQILNYKFKNFDEFLNNPLSIKKELKLRDKICKKGSFSPIIIVDQIYKSQVEIKINSKIYLDIREILVRI
ncbi:epoxyqueuosine reductase QueH [Campylobacter sp. FMV-PI01]|uniref:Epoxyqueuosine reductase QueH n=1 Tax=Campylobacter portucalensis TaxID=2608384 RepID=A0A6L5WFA4_9BACT|nr:epoxyqueuosine reductase QueH [Campylobacter portucalensis]MSN95680.1 epoxyqueuosine reductase QueH [Campylobacter portucalensis]